LTSLLVQCYNHPVVSRTASPSSPCRRLYRASCGQWTITSPSCGWSCWVRGCVRRPRFVL